MTVRKKSKAVKMYATLKGDSGCKSYGLKGVIFMAGMEQEVDSDLFKACTKAKLNGNPVFDTRKDSNKASTKK